MVNNQWSMRRPLFYLSLLLIILAMVKDFKLTINYSGAALRNRIVSARYMHAGQDPYFSKWHEGQSDKFLDPIDSPELEVNRCTVPPSLLLIHEPLALLDYSSIKIIWFLLQVAALGLIIILFLKLASGREERELVIIAATFIIVSDSWHLHVERGQMYIFYALLLTIAYWLSQKKFKLSSEASGFVLGISTWLRPTLILMNIPLLIAGKWRMIAGHMAGLLSGLIISLLAGQQAAWESYFKAMKLWSHAQLEGMPLNLSLSHIKYPAVGEGIDLSKWGMDYDMEFFSVQALAKQYAGLNLNSLTLSVIFISLLLLLVIYFKSIKKAGDYKSLFISGFLIVMLSEYFLPAPRASYNYVQWIFLILLVVKEIKSDQKLILILLLSGLLLNVGFGWIPENRTIGEMALWIGSFLLLHSMIYKKKPLALIL
jgi:hypothetical protein